MNVTYQILYNLKTRSLTSLNKLASIETKVPFHSTQKALGNCHTTNDRYSPAAVCIRTKIDTYNQLSRIDRKFLLACLLMPQRCKTHFQIYFVQVIIFCRSSSLQNVFRLLFEMRNVWQEGQAVEFGTNQRDVIRSASLLR